MSSTQVLSPTSRLRFGLARVDITPPVGIYHPLWGAARHHRSTGVHRPLTAEVMAFGPAGETGPRLLRAQLDSPGLVKSQHEALLNCGPHYHWLWPFGGGRGQLCLPPYHIQVELRRRFPELTLVFSPMSGDLQVAYLLPQDRYGKGLYQEEPSILAAGCLEMLTEAITGRVEELKI